MTAHQHAHVVRKATPRVKRPTTPGYKTSPAELRKLAQGIRTALLATLSDDDLISAARSLMANDPRGVFELIPDIDRTEDPRAQAFFLRMFDAVKPVIASVYEDATNEELERLRVGLAVQVQKAAKKPRVLPGSKTPISDDFIRRQTARLVVDITREQKLALKDIIASRFEPNKRPELIVREIKRTVGLTAREARAVKTHQEALTAKGVNDAKAQASADRYAADLLDARAVRIARTETVAIEAEARVDAWQTAQETGELSDEATMEWVTVGNPCDECDALDGEEAAIGDTFPGGVRRPPLHPQCRCDVLLHRLQL